MELFLLRILDLFRWAFVLVKIDYEQLRGIVAVKLLMDNRRQIGAYNRKPSKEPGNAFVMTLFFYSIFGVFIAMMLYAIPSFMVSMIIFFSYIMVMIAMTLITDFSSVLLDTSDNTIILPKPIHSRTLFAARITHIFLYIGQLTAGLSLIPAAAVAHQYGWIALAVFILLTVLAVMTAVFLTNTLYLLILQFANEEKLKNVINYFQIIMAVVIMGGYQLMPRMVDYLNLRDEVFTLQAWHFLAPPVWMAGAMEALHYGLYDTHHVVLLGCAVIIPFGGFYLANRFLTPVFSRKLSVMGTTVEPVSGKEKHEKGDLANRLAGWLTTGPVDRAAFELIYKILGRDRKLKLKIYPSFGYIIVFGLIMVFRSKEDIGTTLAELHTTEYHLLLLYLTFIILQIALHEVSYSDDFKASWIYFSSPLEKPGHILTGTLKALFVRLFVPGFVVVCSIVLSIWGVAALDDVVFALFNNILMFLVLAMIGKKHLPLSIASNVKGQSGNFLRGLLTFLVIALLGAAHYLLSKQEWNIFFLVPVQLLLIGTLYRAYHNMRWSHITF
jgi:ABC-2 type transport system permease protein